MSNEFLRVVLGEFFYMGRIRVYKLGKEKIRLVIFFLGNLCLVGKYMNYFGCFFVFTLFVF